MTPETILDDVERLLEMAGLREALDPSRTTILKDNISWHFPFPGANTTPWQLEGVTRALRVAGYADISCVQNKTVVTNAFKGEDLNHYLPIFDKYRIPVLYNFRDADMKWIEYKPKAKMLVLDKIFPEGIRIPDYFEGKNIVHLPTMKCVAGDTQLTLADGSVRSIREIVQERTQGAAGASADIDGEVRVSGRVDVMAMDPNGKVGAHSATWFWRTRAGDRQVLRLRTRSGRSLTLTADHLLFTPRGWTPAGELAPGDRVAIARHLAIPGSPQTLPKTHASEPTRRVPARGGGRKYTTEFVQQVIDRYCDGRTASEDLTWDAVVEMRQVEAPDDLYDITVPGAESFIANGIVAHNCHIYTTTTGAMKNAFGGLLNTKRHYTHSWIHATLVDLLAIQKEIHSGLFAVMDGTTAGNGPGPRTMFPVIKDYMLASADQVAIDAVAAKMMGFDPMSLEFIARAHEAKLGVGRPEEIEIVGADISNESWGFRVGDNGASRIGDLLWFGPLKSIQNLFFRTPLVNVFIFGSEAYHDFYRWPAKDRATFERWQRDTAWGQLFAQYAASGSHPALAGKSAD